jgi:hypothetical protein
MLTPTTLSLWKICFATLLITSMPACAVFQPTTDQGIPQPPVIKELQDLKVPADLAVVQPQLNRYTAATAAAQSLAASNQADSILLVLTCDIANPPNPVSKDVGQAPGSNQ